MRRVVRSALDSATLRYLARKQSEVDSGRDVKTVWQSARRTAKLRVVFDALRVMAGDVERCMFCGDSRGVDVEHYRPKAPYPELAFSWPNHLLACAGCNRTKGDRFDVLNDGTPLLLDPSADDPWAHLIFEPLTGLLAARVDSASGESNPRGAYTIDHRVLPLNHQAVAENRRRASLRLRRDGKHLSQSAYPLDGRNLDLINEFRANEFGLATWFVHREGSCEFPFRDLRERRPDVWTQLIVSVPAA